MKKFFIALFSCLSLLAVMFVGSNVNAAGETTITKGTDTFNMITSLEELTEGDYIIGAEGVFAGELVKDVYTKVETSDAVVFHFVKNGEKWDILNGTKYVSSFAKKIMKEVDSSEKSSYTISVINGLFILNISATVGSLQYNSSSPRFTTYTSSQSKLNLYKKVTAPVGPTEPAEVTSFKEENTLASLAFNYNVIGEGEEATASYSNPKLRFGAKIAATSYNAEATYGVILIKEATRGTNTVAALLADAATQDKAGLEAAFTTASVVAKFVDCTTNMAKVNEDGVADATGEYYQFAAVLDATDHESEAVYAVGYMILDDNIYLMNEISNAYSVISIASKYYVDELISDTIADYEYIVEIIFELACLEEE